MQERYAHPSRRHLVYLNTNLGRAEHFPQTPQIQKKPFASIATFCVGNLSHIPNDGNEIIKQVKNANLGHGVKRIPLITQPITPAFEVKNRGHLGGGTSPEALRRAKRKAKRKIER